jgi:hypothetical protein
MKLPPETCSECSKQIVGKAIANVFDDRCVCSLCYKRLSAARRKQDRERERAERNALEVHNREQAERLAREEWEHKANAEPATEAQLGFANALGLAIPPGASKLALTRILDTCLSAAAPREVQALAAELGIHDTTVPHGVLRKEIGRRKVIRSWVYSVIRHILKADWIFFGDSRLPGAAVTPLIEWIAGNTDLEEAISEQEEGYDDDFADACCDLNVTGDRWFFFGSDGPSPRSAVYRTTRQAVEQSLANWLSRLPRRVVPAR